MSHRMAYLLRRLTQVPFVLVVVSLSVFALIHVTPGDPIQIMLGMETSPDAVATLQKRYHFDRPLAEQYVIWVTRAIQGDLGESIRQRQPVTQMIAQRFPVSLQLAVACLGRPNELQRLVEAAGLRPGVTALARKAEG